MVQVGDFIIMRLIPAQDFSSDKRGEQEFRLINDDAVEGVVADPRGITRA